MTPRAGNDHYHRSNDMANINLIAETLYRAGRVAWYKYCLRVMVAGTFHNWDSEIHKQIIASRSHTYCQKGCETTRARAMMNVGVMPASHLVYAMSANIQWTPSKYRDTLLYFWGS